MDSVVISFVSACTALVASVLGPWVSLAVAKRQFNASVLSANRQKWIETLREMVAELISIFVAIMVVKKNWKGPWDRGFAAMETNPHFVAKLERATLVEWKIRLLVKPHEPGHLELMNAIEATIERLRADGFDEAEMQAALGRITTVAQEVLKYEWQRVKRGV